jgi:hypothetical protein
VRHRLRKQITLSFKSDRAAPVIIALPTYIDIDPPYVKSPTATTTPVRGPSSLCHQQTHLFRRFSLVGFDPVSIARFIRGQQPGSGTLTQ